MPEPEIDYPAVFVMRAQGETHAQIAARFGVHRSTIGRILAGGEASTSEEPGQREVEIEAVAAQFIDPDPTQTALLGAARTLARKLDQVERATTAASGLAAASLVRQYIEVLDGMKQVGGLEQLHAALVGDVDSEAERFRDYLVIIASGIDGSIHPGAPRLTAQRMVELAREAL